MKPLDYFRTFGIGEVVIGLALVASPVSSAANRTEVLVAWSGTRWPDFCGGDGGREHFTSILPARD